MGKQGAGELRGGVGAGVGALASQGDGVVVGFGAGFLGFPLAGFLGWGHAADPDVVRVVYGR